VCRLSLTVANQYLPQLDEATAAAVFGNVGSLVSFQVGPGDDQLADGQPIAASWRSAGQQIVFHLETTFQCAVRVAPRPK
jgi:hypothetical protein